jgi:small subunit ribosomal protein S16
MLVIRLQRPGRENTPTYRIVVSEKARSAKTGMHEILGHYLTNREQPVFECNTERVAYWISKGAQPSDTMARLLKKNGMKDMDKFIVRYAKQRSRKDPPPEAAAPAAAPAAPAAETPAA